MLPNMGISSFRVMLLWQSTMIFAISGVFDPLKCPFWPFFGILTVVKAVLWVICHWFVLASVESQNWRPYKRFGSHYNAKLVEKCMKKRYFPEKWAIFDPRKIQNIQKSPVLPEKCNFWSYHKRESKHRPRLLKYEDNRTLKVDMPVY